MSTWSEWFFGTTKPPPMKPIDAAHHPILRDRFVNMMDNTEPPETFKASEVAQSLRLEELRKLGYETWEEALPGVKEAAWEFRAFGNCEIIKRGRIVPDDIMAWEVEGSVRIRRLEENDSSNGVMKTAEALWSALHHLGTS